MRVAGEQQAHDAFALGVGEPVVRDQQGAADPIQRIVLAAPVAERRLLDTAADVIDRRVREADGVEVIDHDRRVGEPVGEAGGVAAERVDDRDLDLVTPRRRLGASSQSRTTWPERPRATSRSR